MTEFLYATVAVINTASLVVSDAVTQFYEAWSNHVAAVQSSVILIAVLCGISAIGITAEYYQTEIMVASDILYESGVYPAADYVWKYGIQYVCGILNWMNNTWNHWMYLVRGYFTAYFRFWGSVGQYGPVTGIVEALIQTSSFLLSLVQSFFSLPDTYVEYLTPMLEKLLSVASCMISTFGDAALQIINATEGKGIDLNAIVDSFFICMEGLLEFLTLAPITGGYFDGFIMMLFGNGQCFADSVLDIGASAFNGTFIDLLEANTATLVGCVKSSINGFTGNMIVGIVNPVTDDMACFLYWAEDCLISMVHGDTFSMDSYFATYFRNMHADCSLFQSECILNWQVPVSDPASGCEKLHNREKQVVYCVAGLADTITAEKVTDYLYGFADAAVEWITLWKPVALVVYTAVADLDPGICSPSLSSSDVGSAVDAVMEGIVTALGDTLDALTGGKLDNFFEYLYTLIIDFVMDLVNLVQEVKDSATCFTDESYTSCIATYPNGAQCSLHACFEIPVNCLNAKNYTFLEILFKIKMFDALLGLGTAADAVICPFTGMVHCFEAIFPCERVPYVGGNRDIHCTRVAFQCLKGITAFAWIGVAGDAALSWIDEATAGFNQLINEFYGMTGCFGGTFGSCVHAYPDGPTCSIRECFAPGFECIEASGFPLVSNIVSSGILDATLDLFGVVDDVVCPFVAMESCFNTYDACVRSANTPNPSAVYCAEYAFDCISQTGTSFSFLGTATAQVLSFILYIFNLLNTAINDIKKFFTAVSTVVDCFDAGIPIYCYEKCPSTWDGTVSNIACNKDAYDRKMNLNYQCEPQYEQYLALCYEPCDDGYVAEGTICRQPCPSGYKYTGAKLTGLCYESIHIYGKGCCCLFGHCCHNCESGYTDDGCTCAKGGGTKAMKYYNRTPYRMTACTPGYVFEVGACYKICPPGYSATTANPLCYENCPSGYTNFVFVCSRPLINCEGAMPPDYPGGRCSSATDPCTESSTNFVLPDPIEWVGNLISCLEHVKLRNRPTIPPNSPMNLANFYGNSTGTVKEKGINMQAWSRFVAANGIRPGESACYDVLVSADPLTEVGSGMSPYKMCVAALHTSMMATLRDPLPTAAWGSKVTRSWGQAREERGQGTPHAPPPFGPRPVRNNPLPVAGYVDGTVGDAGGRYVYGRWPGCPGAALGPSSTTNDPCTYTATAATGDGNAHARWGAGTPAGPGQGLPETLSPETYQTSSGASQARTRSDHAQGVRSTGPWGVREWGAHSVDLLAGSPLRTIVTGTVEMARKLSRSMKPSTEAELAEVGQGALLARYLKAVRKVAWLVITGASTGASVSGAVNARVRAVSTEALLETRDSCDNVHDFLVWANSSAIPTHNEFYRCANRTIYHASEAMKSTIARKKARLAPVDAIVARGARVKRPVPRGAPIDHDPSLYKQRSMKHTFFTHARKTFEDKYTEYNMDRHSAVLNRAVWVGLDSAGLLDNAYYRLAKALWDVGPPSPYMRAREAHRRQARSAPAPDADGVVVYGPFLTNPFEEQGASTPSFGPDSSGIMSHVNELFAAKSAALQSAASGTAVSSGTIGYVSAVNVIVLSFFDGLAYLLSSRSGIVTATYDSAGIRGSAFNTTLTLSDLITFAKKVVTCTYPADINGTNPYNVFCLPLIPYGIFSFGLRVTPNRFFPMQIPWPEGFVVQNCTNTNMGLDQTCDDPFSSACGTNAVADNCDADDGQDRPLCPHSQYCRRTYDDSLCAQIGLDDPYGMIAFFLSSAAYWYDQVFTGTFDVADADRSLYVARVFGFCMVVALLFKISCRGLPFIPFKFLPTSLPVLIAMYLLVDGKWWPLTLYAINLYDQNTFRIVFYMYTFTLFSPMEPITQIYALNSVFGYAEQLGTALSLDTVVTMAQSYRTRTENLGVISEADIICAVFYAGPFAFYLLVNLIVNSLLTAWVLAMVRSGTDYAYVGLWDITLFLKIMKRKSINKAVAKS